MSITTRLLREDPISGARDWLSIEISFSDSHVTRLIIKGVIEVNYDAPGLDQLHSLNCAVHYLVAFINFERDKMVKFFHPLDLSVEWEPETWLSN